MNRLIMAAIRCFLVLLVPVGAYALSAQLAAHGNKNATNPKPSHHVAGHSKRTAGRGIPLPPWDACQTSGRRWRPYPTHASTSPFAYAWTASSGRHSDANADTRDNACSGLNRDAYPIAHGLTPLLRPNSATLGSAVAGKI